VTVNATPNDPVQSQTGVWQQGGSHDDRNLLDFNEITVDDHGRVLYGYSDGCVTEGCISGTAGNDFVAFMRVARQSGGKSLFANLDTTEPVAAKPPCLSGTRDPSASHLTWKAPDNGGSDIVLYQIFRGTSPGTEILLGQTDRTTFNDRRQIQRCLTTITVSKRSTPSAPAIRVTRWTSSVVTRRLRKMSAGSRPKKLTDPAGDNHAVLGIAGPTAGTDLLSFQIAQPWRLTILLGWRSPSIPIQANYYSRSAHPGMSR
jgi:hypothetical protein